MPHPTPFPKTGNLVLEVYSAFNVRPDARYLSFGNPKVRRLERKSEDTVTYIFNNDFQSPVRRRLDLKLVKSTQPRPCLTIVNDGYDAWIDVDELNPPNFIAVVSRQSSPDTCIYIIPRKGDQKELSRKLDNLYKLIHADVANEPRFLGLLACVMDDFSLVVAAPWDYKNPLWLQLFSTEELRTHPDKERALSLFQPRVHA